MRNIIISDIHGCYYTLLDLLKKVNFNYKKDSICFAGDYIDRGGHSKNVLDLLFDLRNRMPEGRFEMLLGNHEQFLIDAIETHDKIAWFYNGGYETIESFGRQFPDDEDLNSYLNKIHDKLLKLPLYKEYPSLVVCHAGMPEVKIKDNKKYDILWNRDWIKTMSTPNEKRVVFGHTPNRSFIPYETINGNLCIDCGCVFGGNLCAYIEEDGRYSYELVVLNRRDLL